MQIGIGIGVTFGGGSSLDSVQQIQSGSLVGYWKDPVAGSISTWVNEAPAKPASNGDFTQGTGTNQPAHEATGIGGRSSLLFDGVDNFMTADGVAAEVDGTDQPVTIIMVYQLVSATNVDRFWSFGNSGDADSLFGLTQSATPAWFFQKTDDGGGSVSNIGAATIDTTAAHVFALVHSGTAISTWIDGTPDLVNDASNVGALTLNRFTLAALRTSGAASNFGNVRYATLAVWNAALSTGDRVAVQNTLKAKYGTP